jgi:hypothetical protein
MFKYYRDKLQRVRRQKVTEDKTSLMPHGPTIHSDVLVSIMVISSVRREHREFEDHTACLSTALPQQQQQQQQQFGTSLSLSVLRQCNYAAERPKSSPDTGKIIRRQVIKQHETSRLLQSTVSSGKNFPILTQTPIEILSLCASSNAGILTATAPNDPNLYHGHTVPTPLTQRS